MKITFRFKGGEGSGHFDHEGIPNHRGGSLPEGENRSSKPKEKVLQVEKVPIMKEGSDSWDT